KTVGSIKRNIGNVLSVYQVEVIESWLIRMEPARHDAQRRSQWTAARPIGLPPCNVLLRTRAFPAKARSGLA
ncbi:hypothetical protein, partial [Brucella intermedia]|uniref:hypothetical protein n=1 Tax=Brucella intermedia TaxID=94625 RepID=UPI00235E5282